MAEVAHRACVGAIGADPCLGDVEIDFHDPSLAPELLDQECEIGFGRLTRVAAALPQEGVLGGLLADRRTAADATARGIALGRILDGVPVEPAVLAALPVLGGDRGADHVAIHLIEAHPVLGHPAPCEEIAKHGRRDRRRHKAVSEHPEHAEQDQADDDAEQPAEEAASLPLAFEGWDAARGTLRHGAND